MFTHMEKRNRGSFKLENTFQIIKSNCKPITAKSTSKPCTCLLNTSSNGDSTLSWAACSRDIRPQVASNTTSNPTWHCRKTKEIKWTESPVDKNKNNQHKDFWALKHCPYQLPAGEPAP